MIFSSNYTSTIFFTLLKCKRIVTEQLVMKYFLITLLILAATPNNSCLSQQVYNNCNTALELCPNQVYNVTNSDANITFCPGCEDDFTFCFAPNNSIWFKFNTNTVGGAAQVNFSNLIFQLGFEQGTALQATILSASIPCNADSYTAVGTCESNGATPFSLTATLNPSTTYYIVVSGDSPTPGVTTPAECTFDISISGEAVERPIPTVSITPTSYSICKNDVFIAEAHTTNCPGIGNFKWFIDGLLIAETTDSVLHTNNLQDGSVVSVENQCYSQCPEKIVANTSPISVYSFLLNAGNDTTIEKGQSAQLHATTTAPFFYWQPTFFMEDSTALYPIVFPNQTTTFTITASENGCVQQDFITVFMEEELVFPTTFSPNDDGVNDTWEIVGVENYPDCYLKIFNRWGQVVYQSTGYSNTKAWNGTSENGKLAEGVYFYIFELRNEENKQFKGSITLIR
jgi:gliding motility-associated-like protein